MLTIKLTCICHLPWSLSYPLSPALPRLPWIWCVSFPFALLSFYLHLVCLHSVSYVSCVPEFFWATRILLTVLETGSLRLGWHHGQVRVPLQVTDFSYLHMVEGARKLSGASFVRVLMPFMRIPPSKAPPYEFGLTFEFWENTDIQTIAMYVFLNLHKWDF